MSDNIIKVNDMQFKIEAGQSMTFPGKLSGKTLSGINLMFSVWGQQKNQAVEELFKNEIVQVEDPFSKGSYKASLRQTLYSYQEGRPEYHYTAEIRELDMVPKFDLLDIEGHKFPVVEYQETDLDEDGIGRHALLRLSNEQFLEFKNLLKKQAVKIRRVGIDEEPIFVRYGLTCWSKHNENEEVYYKQIVNLYPLNLPAKSGLPSGVTQDALVPMVLAVSVRFEALLEELTQSKIISAEKKSALLNDNFEDLLKNARIDEIFSQIDRVGDASEYF